LDTNLFSVDSAKIVLICKNGKQKCFGFVRMVNSNSANVIIENLDGKEIKGRKIRIEKLETDPTIKNATKLENDEKNDGNKSDSSKKVIYGKLAKSYGPQKVHSSQICEMPEFRGENFTVRISRPEFQRQKFQGQNLKPRISCLEFWV